MTITPPGLCPDYPSLKHHAPHDWETSPAKKFKLRCPGYDSEGPIQPHPCRATHPHASHDYQVEFPATEELEPARIVHFHCPGAGAYQGLFSSQELPTVNPSYISEAKMRPWPETRVNLLAQIDARAYAVREALRIMDEFELAALSTAQSLLSTIFYLLVDDTALYAEEN